MKEMQIGGMVGGALFLIGIVAIFTSGGNTMNMIVGDALIAAAGIAIVALGSKKPA
jgi:NADH:ubiquinone oxidoreductase subunit K